MKPSKQWWPNHYPIEAAIYVGPFKSNPLLKGKQTMSLTNEEMRMLAKLERQMDVGQQSFVVTAAGDRFAFSKELLARCGIMSGQTVSHHMLTTLMQLNLDELTGKSNE